MNNISNKNNNRNNKNKKDSNNNYNCPGAYRPGLLPGRVHQPRLHPTSCKPTTNGPFYHCTWPGTQVLAGVPYLAGFLTSLGTPMLEEWCRFSRDPPSERAGPGENIKEKFLVRVEPSYLVPLIFLFCLFRKGRSIKSNTYPLLSSPQPLHQYQITQLLLPIHLPPMLWKHIKSK